MKNLKKALTVLSFGAGQDSTALLYKFILDPKIRFKGKPGEQGTFFVRDPAGNALEFKTFKTPEMIFETGDGDDK